MCKCKNCGKKLEHSELTHCSNKCLFMEIHSSKSITESPAETWEEEPWI